MMNRQIKIAVIVAIILILSSGGYFAYTKYFSAKTPEISENENIQPPTENNATSTPEKTTPKEITVLPGYKLYKNSEFGFEIQYPETWIVDEENIENVRGENTKAFYFKKPNSDLRFAILPRDGLSYGLPSNGASSEVLIGGSSGNQRKWTLPDGRRLWLLNPRYGLYNWSEDIGRIDIQSSATDPAGDIAIFETMLNSFKLSK
ncbi:hypothetical protein KKH14_02140 [Patescibacteria group bacterium]|nr:hypothetical protein [Patescibacteria group bacterium]